MSAGLGIAIAFEPVRAGGPRLSIVISKPVIDDAMTCWACRVRIDSGTVLERDVYGASSVQALALATALIPRLVETTFPGETFTENGLPVVLSTGMGPGWEPPW